MAVLWRLAYPQGMGPNGSGKEGFGSGARLETTFRPSASNTSYGISRRRAVASGSRPGGTKACRSGHLDENLRDLLTRGFNPCGLELSLSLPTCPAPRGQRCIFINSSMDIM